MKFFALSILLLMAAWLLPYHRSPWPTFGSEILTFLSASFLLLGLAKDKIEFTRPQLLLLPFVVIPLIQYAMGQNLYFSNALFSFAYFLFFILMVVAGYNLSKTPEQREKTFTVLCLTFVSVGLISSIFAILQWLNMHEYLSGIIYQFNSNRPYANLAQPNNLATLLILGLFCCLYFFEKRLISNYCLIPITLLLMFGVVLAQSRTSIVVCAFFIVYWLIKQFRQQRRFGWIHLGLWVAIFIVMTSNFAALNQWLFSVADAEVTAKGSAIAAKGTSDIRVDMWKQMWIAIQQQPWWGYGWNQTGQAQYFVSDLYQVPTWFKSAHNMVLDLLVWNGVVLGGLLVLYFVAWLYWLNRGVKDSISIVATLIVCAILIHGMLEFPLHYAYFLLPAGFLLGIIQARYQRLPAMQLKPQVLMVIALLTMAGSLITVRDYFLYKQQSSLVARTETLSAEEQKVLKQDIWLIDQFRERVWWIQLDPKQPLTDKQLEHLHRMVANLASKYDLHKYAQVLAYHGQRQAAEQQLRILKALHGQEVSYDELFDQ